MIKETQLIILRLYGLFHVFLTSRNCPMFIQHTKNSQILKQQGCQIYTWFKNKSRKLFSDQQTCIYFWVLKLLCNYMHQVLVSMFACFVSTKW